MAWEADKRGGQHSIPLLWLSRMELAQMNRSYLYFNCDLVPYPSVTAPWAVGLAAQLGGGHHAAVPWASGWADLEHSGF